MTTAELIVVTVDQGLWCRDELELPPEVRQQHAVIKARYLELTDGGMAGWKASMQAKAEAVSRILASRMMQNQGKKDPLLLFGD